MCTCAWSSSALKRLKFYSSIPFNLFSFYENKCFSFSVKGIFIAEKFLSIYYRSYFWLCINVFYGYNIHNIKQIDKNMYAYHTVKFCKLQPEILSSQALYWYYIWNKLVLREYHRNIYIQIAVAVKILKSPCISQIPTIATNSKGWSFR